MNNPADIARALDVAELSAMRGRIVHMPGRVRDRLTAKGILTPRGGKDWTTLGLAVRDHLLNCPTANDASTDRTPATVDGCGRKVE